MLPKILRLGGKEDFQAVFQSKKAIFGTEIALFFRSGAHQQSRIGFAFKQKSFPRATYRNFLKRKGNAIMKELYQSLPKGIDLIILFHKPLPRTVTYQGLKRATEDLIFRLNKEKKRL